MGRVRYFEATPRLISIENLDGAAHFLDEGFCDIEPKTGPFGLIFYVSSTVKFFKNILHLFFWNTRPTIFDFKDNRLFFRANEIDPYTSFWRAVFNGVFNQVGKTNLQGSKV
jgi:hypothetical protein